MEQEWNGRMTALEERLASHGKRISSLERGQETLQRLATAVEVLATKQQSVAESVLRLEQKLGTLEQRPARRWESLVEKVLLALAGAFVAFLVSGGGGL